MKPSFLPIALIISAVLLIQPSDTYAQSGERPNSLEPGAWALLFQVEDLTSLDYFDGMLALKYHLSEKRALRFGAGGNASTGEGQVHLTSGVGLQALYLVYPQPEREVNFYLGAGPQVGFNFSRVQESSVQEFRRTSWDLGLAGRLGAEWFATESISILGEYGNLLGMRTTSQEIEGVEEDFRDYFYRTLVKLGIAAYF